MCGFRSGLSAEVGRFIELSLLCLHVLLLKGCRFYSCIIKVWHDPKWDLLEYPSLEVGPIFNWAVKICGHLWNKEVLKSQQRGLSSQIKKLVIPLKWDTATAFCALESVHVFSCNQAKKIWNQRHLACYTEVPTAVQADLTAVSSSSSGMILLFRRKHRKPFMVAQKAI